MLKNLDQRYRRVLLYLPLPIGVRGAAYAIVRRLRDDASHGILPRALLHWSGELYLLAALIGHHRTHDAARAFDDQLLEQPRIAVDAHARPAVIALERTRVRVLDRIVGG